MPRLQALSLSFLPGIPEGLSALRALTLLSLGCYADHRLALNRLAGLDSLRELELQGGACRGAWPPGLTALTCLACGFDRAPPDLAPLAALREVYLPVGAVWAG